MTEFDKEYLKLLKEILQRGEEVENRTGVNTIKIDKYAFKFDLTKEFPILMTKQLFSRQAITEMLWIWQMASNDVRELHNGKEYAYTIGTAYGYIVDRYKFTEELIWTIKNNPTDRRMVYSLWQNEFLRTAVLPSCVWSTEWNVYKGTLNLQVHQRSCDVALGLPFNVTQYATLLSMIAQVTNLNPGFVSYSINEPHIYVNQIDGIKEQLRRGRTYESFSRMTPTKLEQLKIELENKLLTIEDKESKEYMVTDSDIRIIDIILNPVKPELWLDPSIDDFYKFDNSKDMKHAKVKNYKHMGKLPFKVTQ